MFYFGLGSGRVFERKIYKTFSQFFCFVYLSHSFNLSFSIHFSFLCRCLVVFLLLSRSFACSFIDQTIFWLQKRIKKRRELKRSTTKIHWINFQWSTKLRIKSSFVFNSRQSCLFLSLCLFSTSLWNFSISLNSFFRFAILFRLQFSF